MTIYGRWGQEVEVVRLGTLDDVRELDKREPDDEDRRAIELEAYVVTRDKDTGQLVLHGLPYLRAEGGLGEILDALDEARRSQEEEACE